MPALAAEPAQQRARHPGRAGGAGGGLRRAALRARCASSFCTAIRSGSAIAARDKDARETGAGEHVLQLDSSPLDRASVRYATSYQLNNRVPVLIEVQREELAQPGARTPLLYERR